MLLAKLSNNPFDLIGRDYKSHYDQLINKIVEIMSEVYNHQINKWQQKGLENWSKEPKPITREINTSNEGNEGNNNTGIYIEYTCMYV